MSTLKDVAGQAIAAWNRRDLDRYLELYAPGIALHGYAPTPMDKAAVRGFYVAFFEAFRSTLVVDAQVVEGDLLMMRFHLDMLHVGAFMGVPATGKQVRLDGHTSLRFEGEQVAERWSTADFLGLLVQLGAIPPPA